MIESDRELLELAAKAIGGTLSEGHTKIRTGPTWDTWEWIGSLGIQTGNDWKPYPNVTIHPLEDDDHAFKLAAILNIVVYPLPKNKWTEVGVVGYSCSMDWKEDKLAATRRGIVLVAAEIGRK